MARTSYFPAAGSKSVAYSSARALALALALTLAACGGSADDEGAEGDLDSELLSDASDPAMTGALEDQILVDPELSQQSNRTSVAGVSSGVDGGLPTNTGSVGQADASAVLVNKEFRRRGLMSAPKPRVATAEDCQNCDSGGVTLGAKADSQLARAGKGSCDAKLSYSAAWASRMPSEFKVYPRANVKEAAGVDGGLCNLRVVNFTTPVKIKDVADYYYTRAKLGGYDAEYLLQDGDHVLGGVRDRDDGAYVVFMRRLGNGMTEVDLVANGGR